MIDNMILFRRKNDEELSEFKCKYCDMKFNDKERLKRHSRKAHSENEDFTPNANPFGGF
ncbi:MAG TPA: C2H2-type zinc finger protein [Nitrososphaeraceae archaeon]|nr:C2H2-type zinc finger protein [Nitrososphaeraceae archaeon]